jgi:amino acid transporter
MISANLFVLIALILLALIFIIGLIFSKKDKKKKIDYHNFFIIGIVWLGAGIAIGISTGNYGLFAIGLIFTIMGLAHKKEWKQNIADREKRLKNMSKKDKKRLMIIKGVLVGLVLLGLVAFLIIYLMNQ